MSAQLVRAQFWFVTMIYAFRPVAEYSGKASISIAHQSKDCSEKEDERNDAMICTINYELKFNFYIVHDNISNIPAVVWVHENLACR